jgi:hypothetical protein
VNADKFVIDASWPKVACISHVSGLRDLDFAFKLDRDVISGKPWMVLTWRGFFGSALLHWHAAKIESDAVIGIGLLLLARRYRHYSRL